jgi:transcriptional regulator with XRE-family HTH domain
MSDGTQTTLRDQIEASFNAAEAASNQPVVTEPVEAPITPDSTPASEVETKTERERDEKGRFAAKSQEAQAAPEQQDAPEVAKPVEEPLPPDIPRPTTWKKEYMPAWEKMARGEALTAEEARKIANYAVQREREFATGVSTYRAEAQNAKQLTEALAPFMPTIQSRGLSQADFVRELGRTYHFLVNGQPQEKLHALADLARNVGVPLEAVFQAQGNNLDPVVPKLMQYIQTLENKVNNVASWREQQEQAAINNELARFQDAQKYPHFQEVRVTMGKLLEGGFVEDVESAYQMAVRMTGDALAHEAPQASQPPAQVVPPIDRVAEAAKAKEKVISPKPSTPAGTTKSIDPKNLRSVLENAFDSHTGTGRV